MKNISRTALLFLLLFAAVSAPLMAQAAPPYGITSVQSGVFDGPIRNLQGVTIGTNYDILIYLNGNFYAGTYPPTVTWTDPNTGAPVSLTPYNYSTTLITLDVLPTLFATGLGTNQRTVTIQVTQGSSTSSANYTLNAPMQLAGTLPVGTLNMSYSASMVTGGTGPYSIYPPPPIPGLPAGLASDAANPQLVTGIPATVGVYSFAPSVYDAWNNVAPTSSQPVLQDLIQIVAPAVVSQVSPALIPAGSGYAPITVTGGNFVNGSLISWTIGGTQTFLASTTFISPTQLTAYVPTALMAKAGTVSIGVLQPNNINYGNVPLVLAAPVLSSVVPAAVNMGSPAVNLTLTGANFASRIGATDVAVGPYVPSVQFGANTLAATLVNATTLTVSVPAALLTAPCTIAVSVVNPGGSTSGPQTFTINSTLAVTTTSLPNAFLGNAYGARLYASGGGQPYQWAITGLPPGMVSDTAGNINGTPQMLGNFNLNVQVTDGYGTIVRAVVPLTVIRPLPTITPATLPDATIGVPYGVDLSPSVNIPGSFAVGGGALPDGMQLASNGMLSGTPGKIGTFSFTIILTTDSGVSPAQSFMITVHSSALSVTDSTTTVTAGTAVSITLAATGGVQPYRFSLACSLPNGLSLSGVTISGTPAVPGVTTCHETVTDNSGATAAHDFTITVVPQALTLAGAALPDGKVGVVYSAQINASGGTPALKYSGSGLPDGLTLSPAGAVTGTPGTPGQFTVSVTVTDSAATPVTATASFTIQIAPAALAISTASLPDGVVGVAYTAAVAANGGVKPYTFTITGLPGGVTANNAGAISGAPNATGTFTVSASVKDNAGSTASATFTVKVVANAVAITTTSLPNGTVGTAYSASLAASGGSTPLTWSASGLPGGLSVSSTSGAVTGTPMAPGVFTVTATVKEAGGATGTKTYTVTISLPSTPSFGFGGTGGTASPLQQPSLTVALGSAFPVDITVTLTLTFAADSGPDDPSIQFITGGRTVQVTIPAGSTAGATSIGVQTGTVAGLITITTRMQASGIDITPTPAPTQTIRIPASAPVISQVTAVRTSTGFTVTVTGYAPTRKITQATFQFAAAGGTTLTTTSLTVPVDTLFSPYFSTTAAGSQFVYTQPFTVSGNLQGVTSVTVTLVGDTGSSTAVTATVN